MRVAAELPACICEACAAQQDLCSGRNAPGEQCCIVDCQRVPHQLPKSCRLQSPEDGPGAGGMQQRCAERGVAHSSQEPWVWALHLGAGLLRGAAHADAAAERAAAAKVCTVRGAGRGAGPRAAKAVHGTQAGAAAGTWRAAESHAAERQGPRLRRRRPRGCGALTERAAGGGRLADPQRASEADRFSPAPLPLRSEAVAAAAASVSDRCELCGRPTQARKPTCGAAAVGGRAAAGEPLANGDTTAAAAAAASLGETLLLRRSRVAGPSALGAKTAGTCLPCAVPL